MNLTKKTPFIQSIVPNVQDYLEQVHSFYSEKIQTIMHKINQFIDIATELTQIPQHLALEFSYIKSIPRLSRQEKEIERMMLKDEIEKFLGLKNEVIQYQTGTKYLYPELPKLQRNIQQRKYSKSESTSSDSDKNDSSDSVNQICNLLGTLDLQSKTNEEICQSIESMVGQLSGLTIQDEQTNSDRQKSENSQKNHFYTVMTDFDSKSVQLQQIREKKKVQLFKCESSFHENEQQMIPLNFRQLYQQKLLQVKQLFKTHLENSVQEVTTSIKAILSKALKDIKHSDKAFVPIYKISSFFNKLNMKFYRSEGVIKCLHKYLTKKIKECIMDSVHTYEFNGQEIQVMTNFKLRFFKHILIENIFFIWLGHAVVDLSKIVRQNGHTDSKKQGSSSKIECQTHNNKENEDTKIDLSHEELIDIFSLSRNVNSFDNFIM